ncbi:hypothetical protein BCR33DRAFT_847016 [Rhizoclosmatium globosum]|uniref:G-protein coupled receptors family 1 profile domain-containing protein n=1 Tax=Rhizoclosmatium globosum TaxID=329046 RepID=A0A1Y2CU52_9FUNG|nr:hypothetical protein BCR33DRAFT_847016 [Rhizoclosmatium globosum]|eukprot:ORY50569.1 hypothetical protein BCR33DRAFT_847016 [Rhizoclosmatium globosum]
MKSPSPRDNSTWTINRANDGHTESHATALAFASVGLVVNLVFIVCILMNRAQLLPKGTPTSSSTESLDTPVLPPKKCSAMVLDRIIFVILIIVSISAIIVLASNILNLTTVLTALPGGPELNPNIRFSDTEVAVRYILCFSGYATVVALFCANTILAFERYSVIRYSKSLSLKAIAAIVLPSLVFFACLVTSFILAKIKSCTGSGLNFHYGRPFAMPGNRSNHVIQRYFLVGICYFPISIVIIFGVYLASYRIIAKIVDETYEIHHTPDFDESQETSSSIESATKKQKVAVLIRCALMGFGSLAFYLPTIIIIFLDRLSPVTPQNSWKRQNEAENFNLTLASKGCSVTGTSNFTDHSWFYPVTTILPAIDVLWTPVLILWLQMQHRLVFFRFLKAIRRRMLGY